MSAVDVLAVMDTVDACLHSLRMDSEVKAQHIARFTEARAAVAELIEVLEMYSLPNWTNEAYARFEFGDEAIDRELRRRAALARCKGEQA